MKLGIIIVTYNSEKDIARLLESIILQKCKDLVVYIVDNNSTDQTLEIVQTYQTALSIYIIASKINNGFAKGNNIGIQKAIDDGCDLVFILNPDIQLMEKCIDILVKRIMSDEKIGVIGPIVLYGEEPDNIIQIYGVNTNFKTQKKCGPFGNERWTTDLPAERYVDFVLGGAMMIKSKVLKVTGLFEEAYFMYNDELDIAYRIKKAGYKTLCVRDAIVKHFHDFSPRNKTGYNLMYYYIIRNRYLYFKKFHLYINLTLSLISEFINIPLRIIWSIRRMRNIKLLRFYYSGLLDGILGKQGSTTKSFDIDQKSKKITLTIDYELFLGKETGTIGECMIQPTAKLASVLKKNDSRMTIFWDILHYYKLIELENKHLEIKDDRLLIKQQILDLAKAGHDIQLHIHPHWLDAEYNDGKWRFNYKRFKLHNLSTKNEKEDINTITGCISITKKLMEDLIRQVNPDYRVTTFRAGGYLIEPFDKIKDALQQNEINIDSSVCPHFFNNHGIFSFDFRFHPEKTKYKFEFTTKDIDDGGSFIEVPITTIKIPTIINMYFTVIRRIKYRNLEVGRRGSGVGEYFISRKFFSLQKFNTFFHFRINQLTTDDNYKERFDYVFKKVPDLSTMIIHPKLINSHTLKILDNYVTENKVRFISIKDF